MTTQNPKINNLTNSLNISKSEFIKLAVNFMEQCFPNKIDLREFSWIKLCQLNNIDYELLKPLLTLWEIDKGAIRELVLEQRQDVSNDNLNSQSNMIPVRQPIKKNKSGHKIVYTHYGQTFFDLGSLECRVDQTELEQTVLDAMNNDTFF